VTAIQVTKQRALPYKIGKAARASRPGSAAFSFFIQRSSAVGRFQSKKGAAFKAELQYCKIAADETLRPEA